MAKQYEVICTRAGATFKQGDVLTAEQIEESGANVQDWIGAGAIKEVDEAPKAETPGAETPAAETPAVPPVAEESPGEAVDVTPTGETVPGEAREVTRSPGRPRRFGG
jgi:hypothetical protein